MKQFLIEFRAEYYCQGYEWASFTRLVTAEDFESACDKLFRISSDDWVSGTTKNYKNLTID